MCLQQRGAHSPHMHMLVVVCADDEDGQSITPAAHCVYPMCPASHQQTVSTALL